MGLRNWFNLAFGQRQAEKEFAADEEMIPEEKTSSFADVQQIRAAEALALFEEGDEPRELAMQAVNAPYDASEAEIQDLLSDEPTPSFTHKDEVTIEDVSKFEDPYENAIIEGDISQVVDLGDLENTSSV